MENERYDSEYFDLSLFSAKLTKKMLIKMLILYTTVFVIQFPLKLYSYVSMDTVMAGPFVLCERLCAVRATHNSLKTAA